MQGKKNIRLDDDLFYGSYDPVSVFGMTIVTM